MIIVEQYASSGCEVQQCMGRAAHRTLLTLLALLIYPVVINLLVIYKQQFRAHLQYTFDSIKNGTACTGSRILYFGKVLVASKGTYVAY